MDCDRVFMILTRGPFPTGEPWDEEVETHLETCADCWRLAEALRPSNDVFQESVPAIEGRDLPGYWGDARPAAATVARLASAAIGQSASGGVRQLARPRYQFPTTVDRPQLSIDLMQTLALTSTLTAIAVGLALWWRG
jgi:hypothetical protein